MAAFALMLIGFSQTAGDARAFAVKHHYQIDINQESVAQALANTGAGLFQGMPVSTSLSASSLNDHSGAKTGLASMTSGVTVLLTLLILAPLFSDLPKAVLAAVIIEAVVMGMMNVPEMRRMARVQRFDFWIAVTAILATLVFGVLAGVMIGIALSLLWLIAVTTRPNIALLGREPGTQVYRDISNHPDDEQPPGIAVVRLDGDLFFATADALEDRIRDVIHSSSRLDGIVLDCEGINFVDSQGSAKMAEIARLAEESGLTLRLARVKPAVAATLERDGVLERIGSDHIHGNVYRAVRRKGCDRRQGRPGADLTTERPDSARARPADPRSEVQRLAKKSFSSAPHSASRMPPRTSTRWFRRGSRTTSKSELTAPAFGSKAPKISRATRASTRAPAHMVQGSRVTTSVRPVSRHDRSRRDASRSARISACAVGSCLISRSLPAAASRLPAWSIMTAPTGTSPCIDAIRA